MNIYIQLDYQYQFTEHLIQLLTHHCPIHGFIGIIKAQKSHGTMLNMITTN